MIGKQVTPRQVAITVVIALGIVQFAYWRMLVYREPQAPPSGGPPGGPIPTFQPHAEGLAEAEVDTLAGEEPGFADGPGWKARFCGPNALAMDGDGALLVADSRNHRIRKVTPIGIVSTVAGGGSESEGGGRAEGPAADARFSYPSGVAVLADGSVVISDTGNHRLCKLKDGTVTEWVGGSAGTADGAGRAAQFTAPAALYADASGVVWVLDAGTSRVRQVTPAGVVTTPTSVPGPVQIALGLGGPAAVTAWTDQWTDPGKTPFKLTARSTASAAEGQLLLYADPMQNVVMTRGRSGEPLLVAGHLPVQNEGVPVDGKGNRALFQTPCAVVTGKDGVAYVAEYEGNRIRRVRVPQWLRDGQWASPEPRRRWRSQGGN
jgi:DNA-binding beta-propeller fold protein YncE